MKKIILTIQGKEQTLTVGSVVEVERKVNGITNAGYLHGKYNGNKYYYDIITEQKKTQWFIRICLDRYGTLGKAEDIFVHDIKSIKELK